MYNIHHERSNIAVSLTEQNKKNQDTIHFGRAIYRMLHERSNITASFPRSSRKLDFNTCTLD